MWGGGGGDSTARVGRARTPAIVACASPTTAITMSPTLPPLGQAAIREAPPRPPRSLVGVLRDDWRAACAAQAVSITKGGWAHE